MDYQKILDEFNKENGTYFRLKQGAIRSDKEETEVIKTYHVISIMQQKESPFNAKIGYVKFMENDLISEKQLKDCLIKLINDYAKKGYVSTKVELEVPEGCKVINLSGLNLKGDK